MTTVTRRTMLSLATATAAVGMTGCFGSFAATGKLWSFNDGISSSKWLKWLLFLGMVIVPVYSLFLLGDALIFNTIEFFTDSNPISASRDLGNGDRLAFERDAKNPNRARVEHTRHGKRMGVWYVERRGDSFSIFDEELRLLATTRVDGDSVAVVDGRGVELAAMDADSVASATRRIKETGSPRAALDEVWGERKMVELMARGRVASETL